MGGGGGAGGLPAAVAASIGGNGVKAISMSDSDGDTAVAATAERRNNMSRIRSLICKNDLSIVFIQIISRDADTLVSQEN